MANTICKYCSWKPGDRFHGPGCPETVSDLEEREIAVRAWRLGYVDAISQMTARAGLGEFYERGHSYGQEDVREAEAIDLDQIKPIDFDAKVIDDLFAGL